MIYIKLIFHQLQYIIIYILVLVFIYLFDYLFAFKNDDKCI